MYRYGSIFPMDIPKYLPFNAPFKKSNRVGGVKTPPYERCVKLQFCINISRPIT